MYRAASSGDWTDTTAEASSERVASPATNSAGNDLADSFMTELSKTIQRRPTALPVAFRPMADTIVGPRRVQLSTDHASRRALRRVGKVAATTDDVIHVDEPSVPRSRLTEVIAHELTHVAHPSPRARFFDDVDDSPEERQAERLATVMARAPSAPNVPTLAAAASTRPAPAPPADRPITDVVRRSAPTVQRSSAANARNTVTAAGLAASITGRAGHRTPATEIRRATTPDVVQRLVSDSPSTAWAPSDSAFSDGGSESRIGDVLRDSVAAEDWFAEQLEMNFDALVRALEDRMIVEFERRGGRLWGGL